MANKINIAQVPEVATISQLLGVDANNKWAKIPGAKFATAEQLTAVDNKATNAQTAANAATQTANQASSTAEGIDGKATQALSNSQTAVSTANAAKTAAEKNNDLLMGSVVAYFEGDITIYTGNWVNGTLDPKPAIGQLNSKYRCFYMDYKTPNPRKLTLKGLDMFLASRYHGKLTVVITGGTTLELIVGSGVSQGVISPIDATNNGNGLALYIFSIELCETYCVVDCLYNCTFEQAEPLQVLLNAERGGGGVITVDSSLSTTSINPVENKTVTAALNLKAPLASPAFSGTPTAPTPAADDSSQKIATTEFVQEAVSTLPQTFKGYRSVKLWGVTYNKQYPWIEDGEVFYYNAENSSTSKGRHMLNFVFSPQLPLLVKKNGTSNLHIIVKVFGVEFSVHYEETSGSVNSGNFTFTGLEGGAFYEITFTALYNMASGLFFASINKLTESVQ